QARAHDVLQRRPGFRQCRFDVLQRLLRLCVRIADADNVPAGRRRGRARDPHLIADANGPRVADDELPWSAARKVFTAHAVSSEQQMSNAKAAKPAKKAKA